MARAIKLKFYDKTYIIEYANRNEVREYLLQLKQYLKSLKNILKKKDIKEEKDYSTIMDTVKILIKAGLIEHHKNDMPSDSDIDRWILSIPDTEKFFHTLMSMMTTVMEETGNDRKNTSWEVEEN